MKRITAGLLLTASASLYAQDSFFLRRDIVVSQQFGDGFTGGPTVVADFNGDGRADIAVCTSRGPAVLLNRGNAIFDGPVTSTEPCGPVAGDFNGDGRADIATANHLVLGRGDGTFLPPRVMGPQGISPRVVAAGDFDGDRKPDLIFYTGPTGWDETVAPTVIHVFLGRGDGMFTQSWSFTHPPERGLGVTVIADFNRDSRSDIAVPDGDGVLVFLGRGDGDFQAPRRTATGDTSAFITAGDFNGDGLTDLGLTTAVALGRGDGTFAPALRHPGAEVRSDLGGRLLFTPSAAGDFDGDGHVDMAGSVFNIAPHFPTEVWVLRGRGDGTVMPPSRIGVGMWPQPLNAADFDDDGRTDLVVNAAMANTVSLLLVRPPGTSGLRRAVSAANGRAIVSPGSLATLSAAGLGAATQQAIAPWPTRLGGIGLDVRDSVGVTRSAPLLYASPNQINFQVPEGTAVGEAVLSVVSDRGTSQAGSVQVDAVAPALFIAPTLFGFPRVAATAVRIEPDGTQTSLALLDCSSDDCFPRPLPEPDSRPIYISLYGTGFTNAMRSRVTCSGAGVPLEVVYAGPQAVSGLDQINVRAPSGKQGLGTVVCTIGGVVTNAASL